MGLLYAIQPLGRGLAALVVLVGACGDPGPEAPSDPPPDVSLYDIGGDAAALFRPGVGARRHQGELIAALEGLEPAGMSRVERITMQNDIWGMLQRLGAETSALTRAARTAIARLALPASSFSHGRRPLPPPIESLVEVATELPSLQHERVYGMRRIFGIAVHHDEVMERPSTRALFSRLVAIDTEGRRHLTPVVGEIEWLRFEGGVLREARVWKLSRRTFELERVDEVEHVPDTGADRFVFEFDGPQPLRDLPCLRCHDDDQAMSLPSHTLSPEWRLETLLAEEAP